MPTWDINIEIPSDIYTRYTADTKEQAIERAVSDFQWQLRSVPRNWLSITCVEVPEEKEE